MKKRIFVVLVLVSLMVPLVIAGLFFRTRAQATMLLEIFKQIEAGKTTRQEILNLAASHPEVSFSTVECSKDPKISCSQWTVSNFLLSRLGLTVPSLFYVQVRTD